MATRTEAYIWKQGFPLDTPRDEAIRLALDAAEAHCREQGREPRGATAQVVDSPDHQANGELLVRVDGSYSEPTSEQSTGPTRVSLR